jgi:hypothetical protein
VIDEFVPRQRVSIVKHAAGIGPHVSNARAPQYGVRMSAAIVAAKEKDVTA